MRKQLLWSGAALLILGAACWVLLGGARSFDREAWLLSGSMERGPYPRLELADELIATERLLGLDRVQVIELLGEPGEHGYFQDYDLVYWLGPERSYISVDSEWLAVKLGADGKVTECQLVRD